MQLCSQLSEGALPYCRKLQPNILMILMALLLTYLLPYSSHYIDPSSRTHANLFSSCPHFPSTHPSIHLIHVHDTDLIYTISTHTLSLHQPPLSRIPAPPHHHFSSRPISYTHTQTRTRKGTKYSDQVQDTSSKRTKQKQKGTP